MEHENVSNQEIFHGDFVFASIEGRAILPTGITGVSTE